jgi:HSP20 family molecular chaperone IbpA
LLLFTTLAFPMVAASWMLLPRYYNNFFGPSLLDTMLTTPSTTSSLSPSFTTSPSSLLRTLIDESNQLQQQMLTSMSSLSPTYEYMNHETNVTIRMQIPTNMNIENINVQYDEPSHLLWIRGSQSTKDEKNNDHSKEEVSSTSAAETALAKSTMTKHYEFTQTFALNPKIVNVDQFTAHFDHDMLTIVVPKYKIVKEEKQTKVRTIPITSSTNNHLNHNNNNGATTTTVADATTTTTNTEPIMTH